MLIVRWKIGEKPRGRWRTPVDFSIEINKDEQTALRPKLEFSKEYELPGTIFVGSRDGIEKEGGNYCRTIDKLHIEIYDHIDNDYKYDPLHSHCLMQCEQSGMCRAYLACRQDPDYSDFEKVFRQIGNDLVEAWNKAVENAASYRENREREEIITSTPIFQKKEKETFRKVRIA